MHDGASTALCVCVGECASVGVHKCERVRVWVCAVG